jgi:hypothetical protein
MYLEYHGTIGLDVSMIDACSHSLCSGVRAVGTEHEWAYMVYSCLASHAWRRIDVLVVYECTRPVCTRPWYNCTGTVYGI